MTNSFIKDNAKKVKTKDLLNVLNKRSKIMQKFGSGSLEKFSQIAGTFFNLLSDFVKGNYKNVPWWAITAIAFALLYVLNPFDIVPDFIVGLGFVDDASVVAASLKMIGKEVDKYEQWKNEEEFSHS